MAVTVPGAPGAPGKAISVDIGGVLIPCYLPAAAAEWGRPPGRPRAGECYGAPGINPQKPYATPGQ
jgi:hypothetical protein